MRASTFFTTILAGLTATVAAYTTPTTGPVGNPIGKPLLDEQVPVGKPYTITWKPDTPNQGTVTLVLLRGPGNNVIPMYPIVEGAPNTGTFVWTPAVDLEDDETHYALQLIEDQTGRFQWSVQFGIENPDVPKGGAETTTTGTATATDSDATTTVTRTSTSVSTVTVTGTKPAETSTEEETTTSKPVTTKASNLTMTTSTTALETSTLLTTTLSVNATSTKTGKPDLPATTDDEGAASKIGASMAVVAVAAVAFALL